MMKKLLGNESGVALIMVMTAILILMAMWGDFTFESKISRIKTTNMLDKTQSRMMAETALDLAMVRLKLYKEAFNARSSNQNVAASVPVQLLNQLWELPFVYPVPVGPNAGAQVKSAVDTFTKDSFLEGEMKLSVQNISNKFNLNTIRLSQLDTAAAQANPNPNPNANPGDLTPGSDPNDQDGNGIPDAQENKDPNFSMEQQLLKHLVRRLREKGEDDENFRDQYGNVDPIQLVANLKYYMSDKNPRRQNTTQVDMMMDNAEQLFAESKVTPKYGPLSNFSEIHLIPGWDDAIVELIRSEFDVFPTVMIDLNKMTTNLLQMLFPAMNENEIKEFFQWRDNPEKPQFFNSITDFKTYFTTTASIISEANFDEMVTKFQAQGIQFGTSPTLFRVLAEGSMNGTSTTITATVSLPSQTQPAAAANPNANANANGTPPVPPNPNPNANANGNGNGNNSNQTAQTLYDPRIIDITVN